MQVYPHPSRLWHQLNSKQKTRLWIGVDSVTGTRQSGIKVTCQAFQQVPRDHRAISNASSTIVVRI